jgi:hypothetical protein
VKITIDGRLWFEGRAGWVLLGNVGRITGGIPHSTTPAPTTDGWT